MVSYFRGFVISASFGVHLRRPDKIHDPIHERAIGAGTPRRRLRHGEVNRDEPAVVESHQCPSNQHASRLAALLVPRSGSSEIRPAMGRFLRQPRNRFLNRALRLQSFGEPVSIIGERLPLGHRHDLSVGEEVRLVPANIVQPEIQDMVCMLMGVYIH